MTRSGRVTPLIAAPRWRYALIVGLYAYQGVIAGFALTALPNNFSALGATTEAIGAYVAVIGLPWVLQPLWGPVVDRFGGFRMGRRRFWVVMALVAAWLALLRLTLEDAVTLASMATIGGVMMLHSVFASLIDTATDGLIIDQVPNERLGTANAATRIGFVGGISVGAALFAWLLEAHGLFVAALLLLVLGAATLTLALLVREGPDDARVSLRYRREQERSVSLGVVFRKLASNLWRPDALALLILCFCFNFAAAAFRVPLAVELIQQRGWSPAALSTFQAGTFLITGTAGALLVGWWTDRVGPAKALTVLLGLCGAAHVAAALLLLVPDLRWMSVAGPLALGVSATLPTLVFVALAPTVMQASRGTAAASQFALFMAALNLGDVAGAGLAGALAGELGLWGVGMAAATVFAASALLAARAGYWRGPSAMPGTGDRFGRVVTTPCSVARVSPQVPTA